MNLSKVQHSSLSSQRIFDYLLIVDPYFIPKLSGLVDLKDYAEKLSKSADFFYIEDDGAIVSYLAIYCNDPTLKLAYLTSLSTHPDYFGKRLAHSLFEQAIAFVFQKGFSRIACEIHEENIKSMNLLNAFGFTTIGKKGSFYQLELRNGE